MINSDTTRCTGGNCGLRDNCWRYYLAERDERGREPGWRSWISPKMVVRDDYGRCRDYLPKVVR